MEQQERESLLYGKSPLFGGRAAADQLSVNRLGYDDDEESLLGTSTTTTDVLPTSVSSSSSSSFSSSGGRRGRGGRSGGSGGAFSFLCGGNNNSNGGEQRWQRWAFFLAGLIFFVAFFSLLLLLFFDVIHVADDLQPSGPSSPRGRFFQLSDVHMDVLYDAAMNRTTLCRQSGPTEAEADFVSPVRAGDRVGRSFPYGQYGCDSPVELVKSALTAMYGLDSKPDFILITGDIPAHALPTRTVHNQTMALFTSLVRQVFPTTLVLPLLGNNDVYPDYHLPYGPGAWLSYLADLWSPWLGEEQRGTFIRGGYYSMKIPAATNLRVIALNTVLYSVEFVPSNASSGDGPYSSCASNPPADPNGQFMWLKNELAQAKINNEKVIIAGHIPYGVNEYDGSINWCSGYVDSYLSIIYPFAEDVIINQIFAHYHLDEFRVLLSPRDPQQSAPDGSGSSTTGERAEDVKQVAVSNIMIHPSISPQHDNNPSFRYYHYYRETGIISDYDHFYLDLALVNLLPAPRWVLEYTFRGAYAASGVDTTSFAWVWETITSGSSLHFARYLSYKTSLYIANALPNLCVLSSTGPDDYQRCLLSHGNVDATPAQRQEL